MSKIPSSTRGTVSSARAEAAERARRQAEAAAKAAAAQAAKAAAAEAAKRAVAASGKDSFVPRTAVPTKAWMGVRDTFEPGPCVEKPKVERASSEQVQAADQTLSTAKTDYDAAKAKVDEHNKKLSQQLGRIGPGLTDEQKKAYIQQFRADHADDYAAYEAATTRLGDALKQAAELPNMPPSTTLRAMEAAKALASTPEGAAAAKDFAVAVAKKLEANPDYFTGGLNNVSADMAKQELNAIVSRAIPNLYANELRLANGDPKAAGDAFAAQVEGIERLRVFASSAEPIQKGIAALKAGDFEALKSLDKGNAFGKAFAVAGVALGIAKLASGADIAATDYLQSVAALGKDGAELLATGMKALASSARVGAQVANGLETGASFLTRIAPGLGVAANALQTVVDAGKLLGGNGNTGDAVAVVGDAMATVGSVLACTVIGEPVAVPLQVVGTVIGKVGNMMSDATNRAQDVAEQQLLLEKIGLGERAAPLAKVDPGALKVLREAMSPEEVQKLLVRNPDGFTSEYAAREYLAIRNRTAGNPWARG